MPKHKIFLKARLSYLQINELQFCLALVQNCEYANFVFKWES